MKHIIYHRAPTFEDGHTTAEKLEKMLKLWFKDGKEPDEIIVEEADSLIKQQKLANLIAKLKSDVSTPSDTTIYCYDFLSFCSTSFMAAMEQLIEVRMLAVVNFGLQSDKQLSKIVSFFSGYREGYHKERGDLLAHRIAKSGRSYGRPSIDVDIEKVTKLRADGLSYKQIGVRLGQSASLIFSKLPKEIRAQYRNMRYARCGRKPIGIKPEPTEPPTEPPTNGEGGKIN